MNALSRLLVFLAAALSLAAFAQPARNLDELMLKSGMSKQVGGMSDHIRADAARMREQSPKGGPGDIDDATFDRLVKAMERAYAADKLRQLIATNLANRFSVEDEKVVLAWLNSDLGRRLTALEEARDTTASFETRVGEARQYFAQAPRERAALAERFAEALHAGESEVDTLVGLTTAVVFGMSLADPRIDEGAVRMTKEKMEAQRPQAVEVFRKISTAMYAHTYRAVQVSDLARYADFIESPVGVRYHDATRQAVQAAIASASIDLGRAFGEMLPQEPRRS